MDPTPASRHLALCIINDGNGGYGTTYRHRCDITRAKSTPGILAERWARTAATGARALERLFPPAEGGQSYSAADILLAAAELCDYYAQHVKEIDSHGNP